MGIYEDAKGQKNLLVKLRRHIHRHPEPGMREFETAAYIRSRLEEWKIPWIPAGETGTVAVIAGSQKGPVLGLRADIDALEMEELNQNGYVSCNPGVMHACGHDGHSASLLAAAKYLSEKRDQLPGTVKCIFQPGEECGEGAASVVKSGAVDDVEAFFGLHVSSSHPTGCVTIREGFMSAANDRFVIRVKGKGCHGSTPQKGADALLAGAALSLALQTLVSRESSPLDPTVITIGRFDAGSAYNILPENAYLEGSVRTLREERRVKNREIITRMAECTAAAYHCTVETEFQCTAKAVYNDEKLTALARQAAREFLPEESVLVQEESLGAEDFGEFLEVAPVTYMNIGSRNEEMGITAPLHHGEFDIDEDCLPVCMAMYVTFAEKFFGNKIQ
ncbi:amidohydrolase [Clostridium sp. MCC353]|uniref:M20 metallopeptidase family protein n=1 Tax=Clostridium sp. MCC353 TaxID=2592646 RepID=UPI001C00AD85|nr:amidohydrolase [Clostridium sp. MCC353]MBT9778935.1 amidohydrolase [Clostridium sp. MCC353]